MTKEDKGIKEELAKLALSYPVLFFAGERVEIYRKYPELRMDAAKNLAIRNKAQFFLYNLHKEYPKIVLRICK